MTTQTEPEPNHFQSVEIDTTTTFELELSPSASSKLIDSPIILSVTDMSQDISFDLRMTADESVELAHALLAKALQAKALEA